jgi:D-alanine-D-alanine ligase
MSFPGRVAVLMGGTSAEREVSLVTGGAVIGALRSRGVDAVAVDTAEDWWARLRAERPAAAFIALHGRGGEDGTIQGALALMGIPYTGSGVMASALAMDKILSKRVFVACGVPTPPFAALAPGESAPPPGLPLPWVVKPSREGSTVGIGIVREPGEFPAALAAARAHDPWVLVEGFIPGGDLTVGVLGGEPLAAVQIVTETGFYDYRTKYVTGASSYLCPAPLTPQATAELRGLAAAACRALRTAGAARVDVRGEPGSFTVLEVNTVPGMTPSSLLPKSAAACGIDFPELVMRMLAGAGEGDR